ncbi:hypothetical protein AGMMS49960_06060 [Betaproteobacteria bacterium]|nr:hypothetical protein AGMMS49543_04160 [Betaproteobacteria bacterium]GHT99789.1 hypothetical protein AGMMS49960_06060 [Betaproteobacteria bacterium]GHU21334.1 hypothetical protein AGMMS50243_18760 [Betaproteobacteria bacterium]
MKKKFLRTVCALSISLGGVYAHAASNYQDVWWDPLQSGQGFNIGQQGDRIALAWYHYDANGKASFLQLSGTLDDKGVLLGSLYRSSGDEPGDGYDPEHVQTVNVGTAKLSFSSENSAAFEYSYNNGSDIKTGTIPLERFNFDKKDLSLDGSWKIVAANKWSGCPSYSPPSGTKSKVGTVTLKALDDGKYTLDERYGDSPLYGSLIANELELKQAGSIFTGKGTYADSETKEEGEIIVKRLQVTEDVLSVEYVHHPKKEDASCTVTTLLTGVPIE